MARVLRLVSGEFGGPPLVEGSPDLVVEVVSKSSVRKDTVELVDLYWQAGIHEYWLIDARIDPVKFDILKQAEKGYAATRKGLGGWMKSGVLQRSFRFTKKIDDLGYPQFHIESKK